MASNPKGQRKAGKPRRQHAEALALVKECREIAAGVRIIADDLVAQSDWLLEQTAKTHMALGGAAERGEARNYNREQMLEELTRLLLLRRLPDETLKAVATLLRSAKPSE